VRNALGVKVSMAGDLSGGTVGCLREEQQGGLLSTKSTNSTLEKVASGVMACCSHARLLCLAWGALCLVCPFHPSLSDCSKLACTHKCAVAALRPPPGRPQMFFDVVAVEGKSGPTRVFASQVGPWQPLAALCTSSLYGTCAATAAS